MVKKVNKNDGLNENSRQYPATALLRPRKIIQQQPEEVSIKLNLSKKN
jgi:hypothetical protein